MRFYHPRAIDPAGGLYHYFKDDGTVYDTRHRHLVSSTRFVFTYAMAYRQFLIRPTWKAPSMRCASCARRTAIHPATAMRGC
jgi:mannose/cellobiose epimerase-like protein (N-acyl-D-glucosamine 2-epimerase family)